MISFELKGNIDTADEFMKRTSLPVIPSERSDDLHNMDIAECADLILFMAGNQFMAMEEKRAEGTTILTVVHHRETPPANLGKKRRCRAGMGNRNCSCTSNRPCC